MKTLISSIIGLVLIIGSAHAQQQITLEDIWASGKFRPEYVYGLNSMEDGVHYTLLEADRGSTQKINQYAYSNGKFVKTIVDLAKLEFPNSNGSPFKIDSYTFSADEKKLLFSANTESIYRHSTKSNYYVFDFETNKVELLAKGKQRYATFSPKADKIAFVQENNLFVKNLTTNQVKQLTTDGKKNEIINGATDWVYEEEFAFDKAFFWSPSGKYIAFYRFDESKVPEFNMPIYGSLYPKDNLFKYPKAGEQNSKVTIGIVNVTEGTTNFFDEEGLEYIPRVKWSKTDEQVVIYCMNRHQNDLKLVLAGTDGQPKDLLLGEFSDYYVDITDNFFIVGENKGIIYTSEKSGFNHLHYQSWDKNENYQITKGNWDVTEVYGFDEENEIIYYQSAEISPLERQVYSISLKGENKKKLSKKAGWNEASFSTGFNSFINYHSTASRPVYISLHKNSGKEIRVLKDNKKLGEIIEGYNFSEPEFISIPAQGQSLNSYVIKPPNFDENKKYPVLMYVYGGPGSQTVKNSWGGANYLWYQMMAQKGYIIVSVDNRGTGARGEEFKKVTYKQLGKYETEDQITAAKWLASRSYIDETRIGIWGWSYGGYMSSLCLFKGVDVFKTAMAVAPVTNWKYYDSIYTERYMQTPDENEGYDENSPITHVDKLKGNYLLVHGTGDDNVHFQNSIEMVTALQRANKQFDFMMYPNKNHGIYGGNTRYHLFKLLTEYVEENL